MPGNNLEEGARNPGPGASSSNTGHGAPAMAPEGSPVMNNPAGRG